MEHAGTVITFIWENDCGGFLYVSKWEETSVAFTSDLDPHPTPDSFTAIPQSASSQTIRRLLVSHSFGRL